MSTIQIETSDRQLLTVEVEIAKHSVFINDILEDRRKSGQEVKLIQIPDITLDTLTEFFIWLSYHKDDLPIAEDTHKVPKIYSTDWDFYFLKRLMDKGKLRELTTAAKTLGCGPLYDAGSLYMKTHEYIDVERVPVDPSTDQSSEYAADSEFSSGDED